MTVILDHLRKGLIHIQNTDDHGKCLRCCLVRYLHPSDKNSSRIRKIDKYFAIEFDTKDIKCPVKIRDIHNIEKTNLYLHYSVWLWK